MKNEKSKDKTSRDLCAENEPKADNLTCTVSMSSVKSRKSGSIISALIRRTKKNKLKSKSIQSVENMQATVYSINHNIPSNSSLSYCKDEENNEVELAVQNYDQREDSCLIGTLESHHEMENGEIPTCPPTKSRNHFFGKLMKKTPLSEPNCHKYCPHVSYENCGTECSLEDGNESVSRYDQYTEYSKRNASDWENPNDIPTYYVIDFSKTLLDVTLCDGLRYIHEAMCTLAENENYIVQMLKKYLKDTNFQTELLEVITHHSKVQWEAERRATGLSNEMWIQQNEITKAQEQALEDSLHAVERQNRELHMQIEELKRKNERLITRLRLYPEYGARPRTLDGNNSIVTKLTKNNERLHSKLQAYMHDNEMYQKEITALQRHNSSLDNFVRNLQSQVHNLKGMLQRARADHELTEVTLTKQLQANQQLIKDSVDVGDVVLEDLDALKRQLKDLPFSINWTKFKCRGSCLTDLLHVCRSCINELARELMDSHNKAVLRERDLQNVMETNMRLQENLQKSTSELDHLSKKIDEKATQYSEKNICDQKCKQLESEIESIKNAMDLKCQQFEMEKGALLKVIEEREQSEKEVREKCKLLEESGKVISNITSENCELRTQIDGLKRILAESGAGDVARELATSHDKITQFQSQYYQLLAEKTVMVQQLNSITAEKENLSQCQEMYYQQLQTQLKDMEMMNRENIALKNQLETERSTLLSLQTERKRYLEEKHILRNIFGQLKAEISKVQELEGTVSTMSKESSRLAMIAEYNRQLGEKLKVEVEEKENTIAELKSSVQKLNNMQMENTKDKLSLCVELSEICSIKEKLNNSLEKEMQKNIELDQTKKKMESHTNSKLKVFEEMQKNERATLKELLRDFKHVVNQRDNLLEAHKKCQDEMAELKSQYVIQLQNNESLCLQINDKENVIKDLTSKLEQYESMVKATQEKINSEMVHYENKIKQLEKLVRNLRGEKEEQENSVKYLKNNTQRLHNDLNTARASEKEAIDNLKDEERENRRLKDQLDGKSSEVHLLRTENGKLVEDLKSLSHSYEKLLADLEASLRASADKEEIFRREMEESKNILIASGQQLETLNEVLTQRDEEIMRLQNERKNLCVDKHKFEQLEKQYQDQCGQLEEMISIKEKTEKQLNDYKSEQKTIFNQLKLKNKEIQNLKRQCKNILNNKEEETQNYEKTLENVTKQYDLLKNDLDKELSVARLQVKTITDDYNVEKAQHEKLIQTHKEVSNKLVNTIKLLMEEKNKNEEILMSLSEMNEQIDRTKLEKDDLHRENDKLVSKLNDERKKILDLVQEKAHLQRKLEDVENRFQEMSIQCANLKREVNDEKKKIEEILAKERSQYVDKELYNETVAHLNLAESRVEKLKIELDTSHDQCLVLKDEIAKLQHQLTTLEFQRSETVLRLHETQGKADLEHGLYFQAKTEQQRLLAALQEMNGDGKIANFDYNSLINLIGNSRTNPANELGET